MFTFFQTNEIRAEANTFVNLADFARSLLMINNTYFPTYHCAITGKTTVGGGYRESNNHMHIEGYDDDATLTEAEHDCFLLRAGIIISATTLAFLFVLYVIVKCNRLDTTIQPDDTTQNDLDGEAPRINV